jgi:hypothetical protein
MKPMPNAGKTERLCRRRPRVTYLFLVRSMTRIVCLLAFGLFALFVGAAEKGAAAFGQDRDLRAYDNGGEFHTLFNSDEITDVKKLRDFVWKHWTEKRRGYVQVVYRGTDAGSIAYLFIEPNDDRWRIAWRYRHYQALPGTPEYPVVDERDIVTVERCRGSLVFFDDHDQIVRYL